MLNSDEKYDELERINEKLNNLITTVKVEGSLINLENVNATMREKKENNIAGEYRLGIKSPRGYILLKFCRRNNLVVITHTFNNIK